MKEKYASAISRMWSRKLKRKKKKDKGGKSGVILLYFVN